MDIGMFAISCLYAYNIQYQSPEITIVVGAVILGPGIYYLRKLAFIHCIQAFQVPEYQQAYQRVAIVNIIQLILLVSVVPISVLKPVCRLHVKVYPASK